MQHDVIVTLLFTVPEKEHDIRSQIKDINDVVNNIRDNDHGQSNLSFIKIDNDEFDLSITGVMYLVSQNQHQHHLKKK